MTEHQPPGPQPLSQWLASRRRGLDDRLAFLRQRSLLVGRRLHLEGMTEAEGAQADAPDLLRRLLTAEKQMRQMLVDTPVPVLVLEAEGRARLFNKAFARLLEDAGLTPARLYAEPAEALFPGIGDSERIELGRDAQGQRVYSISRQTVLWGASEGCLLMFHDVTPEERARREMQRAIERLEEVNQLKSEFVAIASHELRTPLTGVMSSLELMDTYLERSQGLDDTSRALLSKHLARSRDALGHLDELVNDLLLLEKSDGGYLVCQSEAIDLADWMRSLQVSFQPVAERELVALEAHLPQVGEVRVDLRLLHHCLANLLTNALHYSPAGSEVRLSIDSLQSDLVVSVTDQGPGIAEDDKARIFEPFYRGGNAERAPGSGLGLAIVQRFIDILGGRIDLDSQVGRGSRFTLILPTGRKNEENDGSD